MFTYSNVIESIKQCEKKIAKTKKMENKLILNIF